MVQSLIWIPLAHPMPERQECGTNGDQVGNDNLRFRFQYCLEFSVSDLGFPVDVYDAGYSSSLSNHFQVR